MEEEKKRKGEVGGEMDRLSKEIDRLTTAVDSLSARLGSVLAPVSETATDEEVKALQTPFAQEVRQETDKIQRLNAAVASLTERLEL